MKLKSKIKTKIKTKNTTTKWLCFFIRVKCYLHMKTWRAVNNI
jgi:hypothetical protein